MRVHFNFPPPRSCRDCSSRERAARTDDRTALECQAFAFVPPHDLRAEENSRPPRANKKLFAAGLTAFASLAFASCAVGPNYHRPETPVPAAFKSSASATPAAPVLASDWWTLFQEPELNQLVEATIAANPSIQAAVARVDQARAATRIATGALYPEINLDPSVRRARSFGGSNSTQILDPTLPVTSGRSRISTLYSLPLDLNYELDVWGRVRRQRENARYTEQASADDFAVVRQTAISDVAQGYFTIRLYDTQIEIYQKALDLYRQQLELTRTKYTAGLALQTDLLQAQTQVYTATNQLLDVQRSRVKQEHALAILTGRAPEEFSLAARPLSTAIPVVPAGLPANLLNRRPDVAEAENKLAAANAQIGVAQAAFFPSFSLTGSAGYENTELKGLTNWENRVWSIGPSLNLPIFQGGRLTGELAQAKAGYQELVANYRSAVLGAFRDVEDQLADLNLLAQKADSLEKTLASARENSRLTELQYRQGLTTYLQVLTANQTLLTNELSAAEAQSQRLTASVLLMKALGGGWSGSLP